MRTTLDIDDDLLATTEELARRQGTSVGQVVSMLMRRALTGANGSDPGLHGVPAIEAAAVARFRPFAAHRIPITNEMIDNLRDIEGM